MSEDALKFPVTCHFRVIAENLPDVHLLIQAVLMELGVRDPVEEANVSAGSKYISFNISTVVESREDMARIDQELSLIQGVRMVL